MPTRCDHFFLPLRSGQVIPRGSEIQWGVQLSNIQVYRATPVNLDDDGICQAQTPSGAGALTMNGALVSGGTVTFDYPRAVSLDGSDAGDTTQVVTVTGYDLYSQLMVENITMNGTSTVNGKKAFKTVTGVTISAATTGTVIVGSTNIFGFPFRIDSRDSVLTFFDTAWAITTGTFVAADATTATATTGDVRGTYVPSGTPDGSKKLTFWMWCVDADTTNGYYGVTQYGG